MEATARSPRREATYEDLLKVPAHRVAELVAGELVVSPRPGVSHAHTALRLGGRLDDFFDKPPGGGGSGSSAGWWILPEPELHLGRDVLVPDIAGWRRERLPVLPRVAALTLAPDWVCEITSPSNLLHDRVRKLRIYARERVAHCWLVDPEARVLEVYRQVGDLWQLVAIHEGAEKVRAEPFDAVELDMARWWVPEPEAPPAEAATEAPTAEPAADK